MKSDGIVGPAAVVPPVPVPVVVVVVVVVVVDVFVLESSFVCTSPRSAANVPFCGPSAAKAPSAVVTPLVEVGSSIGPLMRGAYAGLPTTEPLKTMFTHCGSVAM